MSRKDIIRWVIDRMLAHEASITEELALTVEREARAEWGGQRIPYVATECDRKAGRRPLDAAAARAAYAAGLNSTAPTDQLAAEHGISRRTLYRLMKRGPAATPDGTT